MKIRPQDGGDHNEGERGVSMGTEHREKINITEHSHADLSLGTNLNSVMGSTSSSPSSSSSERDSFDSSIKGVQIIFLDIKL